MKKDFYYIKQFEYIEKNLCKMNSEYISLLKMAYCQYKSVQLVDEIFQVINNDSIDKFEDRKSLC